MQLLFFSLGVVLSALLLPVLNGLWCSFNLRPLVRSSYKAGEFFLSNMLRERREQETAAGSA